MDFRHVITRIKNYLSPQRKPSFYELVLATSQPKEIKVEERYCYDFKLTGVQYREFRNAEGRIDVTVPYDGQYDVNIMHELGEGLGQIAELDWGELQIINYGRSWLNEQSIPSLNENFLSIAGGFTRDDLQKIQDFPERRFNIHLSQEYQPNEPDRIPVEIHVKVLDEDEVLSKQELEQKARSGSKAEVTAETLLVESVTTQSSFQRSLSFCFSVSVILPNLVVPYKSGAVASPVISYISMDWPLAAVPIRLRFREHDLNGQVVRNSGEQIIFNPEGSSRSRYGTLEWFNIPLIAEQDDSNIYKSHEIWVEVDEPGEAQSEQSLQGKIVSNYTGQRPVV